MVYQHRFSGVLAGGDRWMFTWWATSGSSIGTIHAAGVDWANSWWTTGGYGTHVAPAVTLESVTTVNVDQATGKQSQRMDSSLSLVGSNASGSLPADVSIVCSLRTALANRSGRGRFYLPQPAVDQLDETDGRIAAAAVSGILNSISTAFTAYVPTGTPVIYSRTLRATNPVTSFDIGNLFDTQRRRESSMLESRNSSPMP